MNNLSKKILIAIALIITLIGDCSIVWSADQQEKIFLKGKGIKSFNEKGELEKFSPEILKSGINDLVITQKGGEFFWKSHDNIKLEKIEIYPKNGFHRERQTIFMNPEGEGFIVVRHDEAANDLDKICPYPLKGHNYQQYDLRTDGAFMNLIVGSTDPYPYPKKNICRPHH